MGIIDQVWDKLSSGQYDDIDQKLTIYFSTDTFNDLIEEYSRLQDQENTFVVSTEEVSPKEIGDFFGATVLVTSKHLYGELNRLGVKYSITRDQQEEILESLFKDLKMFISDPRMPKIRLQNFGTFKPCKGQISRSLFKSFWWRGIGEGTIHSLRKRISWLWAIKQRLIKEEKIRGPYRHNFVFFHQNSYHWDKLVENGKARKIFSKYFFEDEEE